MSDDEEEEAKEEKEGEVEEVKPEDEAKEKKVGAGGCTHVVVGGCWRRERALRMERERGSCAGPGSMGRPEAAQQRLARELVWAARAGPTGQAWPIADRYSRLATSGDGELTCPARLGFPSFSCRRRR